MRIPLRAACMIAAGLLVGSHGVRANASTEVVFVDVLQSSTSIAPAFRAGDSLILDGLVRSQTGPMSQTIDFTVGAGVTGFTGGAGWMVGGPLLQGFSVEILDASTGTTIANDQFEGTLAGVAVSSFAAEIGPGDYQLVATGIGTRESFFDISLSFLGEPPASTTPRSGALPAQGPVLDEPVAFFTQLDDARTVLPTLGAGDTLFLDTLVTSETGNLSQSVTFTLDSGVDGVGGAASWLVSAEGPQLLVANFDLFDASNALVASDHFEGFFDNVALSSMLADIGPGTYTLVATGLGVRDASLNIALTFTGTPVLAVPEPSSLSLMFGGLLLAVACRRRPGRRKFS